MRNLPTDPSAQNLTPEEAQSMEIVVRLCDLSDQDLLDAVEEMGLDDPNDFPWPMAPDYD